MNRRAIGRASAALGGVLCVLIASELSLRAGGAIYARWRLPARAPAQESAFRVLCLGDSFTFGIGAPKGFSYPEQLQALLDHDAPGKFQVINGGVPGSNSSQLLARLEARLDESRPGLVVVLSGANDLNLAESNYWRVLTPEQMPWRLKAGFYVENFYTNLRLYKLIAWLWENRPRPKPAQTEWKIYGRVPEADLPAEIARLRREADRDPGSFREWLHLGILYHRHKDFAEALAAYQKAVQVQPGNEEVHYQLGWMYHLLRDFEKARTEIRTAVRLDPDDPAARQLNGIYLANGRDVLIPDAWIRPLLQYDFERIARLAERRGARIVFQTYPNHKRLDEKLRVVFTDLARAHMIVVADQSEAFDLLKDGPRYYSGDEPDLDASHPNALGYALMASQLLPLVERAGSEKAPAVLVK